MSEIYLALFEFADDWLVAHALVFFRVGPAMFLLPVFGEVSIPMRVRLASAFAFTAIVTPVVLPAMQLDAALVSALIVSEAVIGLMLGFSLRLMIMALRIAGTIAAQATSLSQLLGGAGVDPQPAISQILAISGLALAATLGLHVKVAAMFVITYETIPLGTMPSSEDAAAWAVAAVNAAFALAVTLSLPFVAASLLYNLALGVINRAMPQLMVAFVGAPAITWGALVLLALIAPLILSIWVLTLEQRLMDPFGLDP